MSLTHTAAYLSSLFGLFILRDASAVTPFDFWLHIMAATDRREKEKQNVYFVIKLSCKCNRYIHSSYCAAIVYVCVYVGISVKYLSGLIFFSSSSLRLFADI